MKGWMKRIVHLFFESAIRMFEASVEFVLNRVEPSFLTVRLLHFCSLVIHNAFAVMISPTVVTNFLTEMPTQ